jgi:hypothetical protein
MLRNAAYGLEHNLTSPSTHACVLSQHAAIRVFLRSMNKRWKWKRSSDPNLGLFEYLGEQSSSCWNLDLAFVAVILYGHWLLAWKASAEKLARYS